MATKRAVNRAQAAFNQAATRKDDQIKDPIPGQALSFCSVSPALCQTAKH